MGKQVISAPAKKDQPWAALVCHLMSYLYTPQIKHGNTIRLSTFNCSTSEKMCKQNPFWAKWSKFCVLHKGKRTVIAAACISTTALVISSVNGFRIGLVENFAELSGEGRQEMLQVQISTEKKNIRISCCKRRRLKNKYKCTKISNDKQEIHHIYLASLFSLYLPVGKRFWIKKKCQISFLIPGLGFHPLMPPKLRLICIQKLLTEKKWVYLILKG